MLLTALKFIRLRILVTCSAIAFLGAASSAGITLSTILTIAVLIPWYIHAASANDYSDRFIDDVNLKGATDRPLLAKGTNSKNLWIVHCLSGVAALALSLLFGRTAFWLTVGMLVLDYAYSIKPIRISDRGIFSQLLLATAYVYYPFSLGYLSSGGSDYPWLLSLSIYLAFVARLLLKDFRDVKGDKMFGKMTFVLRHGAKATCIASGMFSLVALLLMAYATAFNFGVLAALGLGFIQGIILLRLLLKAAEPELQTDVVALIAKAGNFTLITILAFYLARSQASLSSTEIAAIPATIGLSFLMLNFLRSSQWQRAH